MAVIAELDAANIPRSKQINRGILGLSDEVDGAAADVLVSESESSE